ncbi:SusC/RagA family TonB-linked outer membrane protein [Leyella stercorea]|uniref:SusC/RagA family TonB-linked outer membrane protein n=1 Tax=Leyella stercorea TaxID=363265 RepID=UPI00242D5F0F|nr:SusC/RagA family TonB-linked outer membrane protein [Leyella stercorea]
MQKRSFLTVVMFLIGMFMTGGYAQTHTVSGLVKDKEMGEPLVGVSVSVKGTKNATMTDLNGNYTIQTNAKDVLEFKYVGMKNAEETVGNRKIINVSLSPNAESLGEVVVTAMGIKRQSETLTYSAQTVGGKDVNDIKSINMINSLQGKSAGLQITPNSTGAGGSSKILFRGNKSISGSNQPLIVIDGVPTMTNTANSQVSSDWGGERDAGDVMSTINPDDIASITLLKGAAASALYGAVAANGAIMITTKQGMAGKVNVNVSSNTTMEMPMILPKFQDTYGAGADGTFSWGNKLASASKNYAKEFFRTGFTTNNSVSLAGGSENFKAYFSYGNVFSHGMTPENTYRSHNLNSKVDFKVLDHVYVDFSAKYSNQYSKNQAAAGYLFNPLTGAYLAPRGIDWNYYKDNYEVYDPARGCNVQNWTNTELQQYGNPYWMLHRQTPISNRNRYEFGGSIKWDITPDVNIQGRMRYERGEEQYTHNLYASSVGNYYPMGRMKNNRYFSDQLYGDVLVNYNHPWGDWALTATAGSSFTKTKTAHVDLVGEGNKFKSPGDGTNIYYPNIFTPNNYYENMSKLGKGDAMETEKRLNAVFATAQVGFKEAVFLDLSARNDWSSALAFTESCSFFYPSVGASVLLNKLVPMGEQVNLFKFRGSYSIVGNDVPIYMSNQRYTLEKSGSISAPDKAPFRTLKPEKTHSLEFGFDGTFFNNRLDFSFTYYKTNTKNQFFSVSAPYESGLRNRYVNAGNVQNQGFEASIGWHQQFNPDFSWSTNFNISYNENKIKELVKGLENGLTLISWQGAKVVLKEGGSYGDLYVRQIKRDEAGKPVKNADGKPVLMGDNIDEMKYAGNMNAKVNFGWSNTFHYKDFTLSFLIDGKFGGRVLSATEATLDGWGVSERTGNARNAGKVVVDGVEFDPQLWYTETGSSNFNNSYANEFYVYKGTNVRMREMSLGYTFRNLFGNGKNLTAALIARNLFFFYKDAPCDPDVSMGTGNGVQGVDIFNLPSSRSLGLNLKLNF